MLYYANCLCFKGDIKSFLLLRYEREVIPDSGSSQMRLQLMNGSAPLPHNSTLSPREAVVMDVSLNTSSERIKVVVSKCWATPTHDPEETNGQTFLESRSTLTSRLLMLIKLQYNFCLKQSKHILAPTVNVFFLQMTRKEMPQSVF